MFNDYGDARVYQAPPGDGRSKQLAPSGDDVTPSGQVVKWSTYDVPSSHGHGQGQVSRSRSNI